jgi:DNA polymerase I-like protein with 3'-5' exonuclease and polymerase domains
MYDLNEREVRQQQQKLLAAYQRTVSWQDYVAQVAKIDGVLTNAFSRKRWFGTPNVFTEAASFHGQSVAADIILRAMVGLLFERANWPIEAAMRVSPICKPLPKPANLLLQVHDNLLFESPKALVDDVVEAVLAVMEQKWDRLGGFHCPVAVEVGEDWQDLVEYKREAL